MKGMYCDCFVFIWYPAKFLREIKTQFPFSENITSARGVPFLIFADSVQAEKHVLDIPPLRLYHKVYHS